MSERQASNFRRGTFTKDHVRIASALNRAHIDCQLAHTVIRYGEFKNGHPLSYSIDILVIDPRYKPVAIEVEGGGSSSRDNLERDAYLGSLGISVLHVDNKVPASDVIAHLISWFLVAHPE